ncbi:glycosyltransferase family 4 protein [Acidihalobacter aeolianus]|uniref:glycosyltransferase family 4 protein n=1 Tax=Acidihalobacter aeolianus TaxID=2792603 RepID=UPI0009F27088|nr:glycosyltransferase family 1 protein [Acidihalobacter aeolianus]
MRIGIDATPLSGRITGIGRYVLQIICELDEKLPEAEFFLYSHTALVVDLPSSRWVSRVGGWRFPSSYFWLKRYISKHCELDNIDVFWASRTLALHKRRNLKIKILSTIYDLNYLLFPGSMPGLTRLAHRLWYVADVSSADARVAISAGTASRLQKELGILTDAIARPGVTSPFGPQDKAASAAHLRDLGVEKPYFLAVGTLEPRKNLETLLHAFVRGKQKGGLLGYQLLLVGAPGWKNRRLKGLLEEAKTQGVRWLGYVSDEQLACLYAAAEAFVFPSRYEGFGIPALEARTCGARVLATDIPEIREAGGEDAVYVPPTVEGFEAGFDTVLARPRPAACPAPGWHEAAEVMAAELRRLAALSG